MKHFSTDQLRFVVLVCVVVAALLLWRYYQAR
jgi:hypothetical protein